MTNNKRYQKLASKWLNNTITDAEREEFISWYNTYPDEELRIPGSFAATEEELKERILINVREKLALEPDAAGSRFGYKHILTLVAAVLVAVSIGIYLMKQDAAPESVALLVDQDIPPGGDKAVLTLANGKTIVLDSSSLGQIAEESGIKISKTADGELLYETVNSPTGDDGIPKFNKISTPRGGQYQVILPDGTRVWLNATSSLTYPTQFLQDKREVTLIGEAYFDVEHEHTNRAGKPFIVKTADQEIVVLGTQFNVNAYEDEKAVMTTLVMGSVKVRHGSSVTKILKPGQQLAVRHDNQHADLMAVDTDTFTAWKDGFFYFREADIYTVMRQFSRWYDIDVVYEIKHSNDQFVGKIPRRVSLSTALSVLKTAGVNYRIKNRQLVIMPAETNEERLL